MTGAKLIKFPAEPILNLKRARELFEEERTIFSNPGGVPLVRVAELLGDTSAEYASRLDRKKGYGTYSGMFGVGSYQCEYLTWEGFLQAVTFSNVLHIARSVSSKEAQGQ